MWKPVLLELCHIAVLYKVAKCSCSVIRQLFALEIIEQLPAFTAMHRYVGVWQVHHSSLFVPVFSFFWSAFPWQESCVVVQALSSLAGAAGYKGLG